MLRPPPRSSLFPCTTLFRSFALVDPAGGADGDRRLDEPRGARRQVGLDRLQRRLDGGERRGGVLAPDRKSTRLNSSHLVISYAVFCLKKKNMRTTNWTRGGF